MQVVLSYWIGRLLESKRTRYYCVINSLFVIFTFVDLRQNGTCPLNCVSMTFAELFSCKHFSGWWENKSEHPSCYANLVVDATQKNYQRKIHPYAYISSEIRNWNQDMCSWSAPRRFVYHKRWLWRVQELFFFWMALVWVTS